MNSKVFRKTGWMCESYFNNWFIYKEFQAYTHLELIKSCFLFPRKILSFTLFLKRWFFHFLSFHTFLAELPIESTLFMLLHIKWFNMIYFGSLMCTRKFFTHLNMLSCWLLYIDFPNLWLLYWSLSKFYPKGTICLQILFVGNFNFLFFIQGSSWTFCWKWKRYPSYRKYW